MMMMIENIVCIAEKDNNADEWKHNQFFSYLPTPPLGQDMTQGYILSGV